VQTSIKRQSSYHCPCLVSRSDSQLVRALNPTPRTSLSSWAFPYGRDEVGHTCALPIFKPDDETKRNPLYSVPGVGGWAILHYHTNGLCDVYWRDDVDQAGSEFERAIPCCLVLVDRCSTNYTDQLKPFFIGRTVQSNRISMTFTVT
jgi:hypothetical protein